MVVAPVCLASSVKVVILNLLPWLPSDAVSSLDEETPVRSDFPAFVDVSGGVSNSVVSEFVELRCEGCSFRPNDFDVAEGYMVSVYLDDLNTLEVERPDETKYWIASSLPMINVVGDFSFEKNFNCYLFENDSFTTALSHVYSLLPS